MLQHKPVDSNRIGEQSDLSSYLVAWVPESSLGDEFTSYVRVDLSEAESPPQQSYLVPPLPTAVPRADTIGLYAFAVPLSEIYSVLVRPPSLGWWFGSLVVNTRSGDSCPALFFHDSECESTIMQKRRRARESFDPFDDAGAVYWGGDEVLRWLRRYADVQRSTVDSMIYLINPSEEDKLSLVVSKPIEEKDGGGSAVEDARQARRATTNEAGMDPVTKMLKEARWKVLEQFSKITTFTRRTAQDIVDSPNMPPQVRRLLRNPEVQTLQDEFDSARLYLARWAMGIAEQADQDRRRRIWTPGDFRDMEESELGDFEILSLGTGPSGGGPIRRRPVTLAEWRSWFDDSGRLSITTDEVKEQIFRGGLDVQDGVRREAWLFLLGVYPWDSSADERRVVLASKRDEYVRLKGAWWERMVSDGMGSEPKSGLELGSERERQREWWKEQKIRIEKDVHRTDRHIPLFAGEDIPHPDPESPFAEGGTNVHMEQMKDLLLTYDEYNSELGYVQGMSDLLAPIYAVVQDDGVAFWGFVGFMEHMERNFARDQSGMRAQLGAVDELVRLVDGQLYAHLARTESTNFFFLFRMLLVWFKRELEWPDVLRLWEVLWTDYLSSSFHLFVAVAIVQGRRDEIMMLRRFDEVLKFVNELAGHIDVEATLVRAEALFRRFRRRVEAIDRRDSFWARNTSGEAESRAANGNSGNSGEGRISAELRQLLSRDVVRGGS